MSLIRPAVLPDELAAGYEGRILRFNGLSSRAEALPLLLQQFFPVGTRVCDVPFVELLAHVAGMQTARFVQAHTILPLKRAFTKLHPGTEHGSPSHPKLLELVAMRALRPGAYLCRRCVDEDLGFHGIAYWRRDHQRPGVFTCSKHGLVLNHTKDSDAFLNSPAAYTGDEFTIDPDWASRVIDSDIVRRFHAICAECMVRTQSIDEVYAARAIRDRAKALDLHPGRGLRTKQLLSSFVRDQLDEAWIGSTLPELSMQPADTPWAPIDAAVLGKRCGITSVVYALILASLFESCDEAINTVLAKPSTLRRSYAPSTQPMVPEAKLRESYSDERGRHASVARALGRPYHEVRDRLLAIGLPDLSRVRPNELVQLVSAMTSAHGVDERMEVFARADRASLNVLQRALAPLMQTLKKVDRSARGRRRGPRTKPSSPPLPVSEDSPSVA